MSNQIKAKFKAPEKPIDARERITELCEELHELVLSNCGNRPFTVHLGFQILQVQGTAMALIGQYEAIKKFRSEQESNEKGETVASGESK